MKLVPYQSGDIYRFSFRPEQRHEVIHKPTIEDYHEAVNRGLLHTDIDLYTLIHEKQIIGCIGVIPLWSGVAEVAIAFSEKIKDYPLSATKACRDLAHKLQEKTGKYHRIQATIAQRNEMNARWAEALGFKLEGVLRAFDWDGSTWLQYSRVVVDGVLI